MMCSRCGLDAPHAARFCPHCGVSLAASPRPGKGDGIEPTLRAIARAAARLCDGQDAQIFLAEGTTLRLVAHHGPIGTTRTLGEPFSLSRGTVHGRAVLEGRVVHVRDLKAVVRKEYPDLAERQRATRVRTMLAAPLLSDGAAIGVITVRRIRVRPFTAKQISLLETFAAQATIAVAKAQLAEELADRNADLAEALDHQTATSEVLGVISASPTDVQSVFETIVASARRLCEASFSSLNLLEGGQLMLTAVHGIDDAVLAAAREAYPQAVDRSSTSGRAILERRVVHIEDSTLDPEYTNPVRSALGLRCVLTVPLLREGQPLGAVSVWRSEVRPFTEKQIALLQTFADQAVIAIENARLFGELTETLEQQTATAGILQAISTSTMDAHPVFQAILEAGVRLIGALFGSVYRFDGTRLEMVAHHNYPAAALEFSLRTFPAPSTRQLVTGRAILERTVVHVPDVLSDEERSSVQQFAEVAGFRSALSVPMLRDGQPIGAITLWHSAPFSDKHIALLKTFADQAVIAVENVRLFTELEARNRDLSEALEQQTATSDVLRVISGSPTDVQPVFDTILESATRLCAAENGILFQYADGAFHTVACRGLSAEGEAAFRGQPARPGPQSGLGRMLAERRPVQIEDVTDDVAYRLGDPLRMRTATLLGARTAMWLPLLKNEAVVGALGIYRREVRPFTDKQIELIRTFADQAVIAIENVRLFTELGQRNRDLTQALEQQTATGEVLRVIGSSPTDTQPVFDAIVNSARRLLGGFSGLVYRRVGDEVHLAAFTSTAPLGEAALRNIYPRPLAEFSGSGEAIRTGTIIVSTDLETDPRMPEEMRTAARARGFRSGVWVPMLREGAAIGAIGVTRNESGAFADEQIALLKTFADQAVIAIENVRLFTELEARNRDLTEALEQQTATSEILRVISSSPTDLGPVMDAVAENAARLCDASDAQILRADGETITLVASYGALPTISREPRPISRRLVGGRAIIDRVTLHIPDVTLVQDEFPDSATVPLGVRTVLATPLLREGAAIGVIMIRRMELRPFSDKQVQLLRTFADQAVIAIENVRLFKELEARNRELTKALEQQTATSDVLRIIAQSPTELQPVLDAIATSAVRLCAASDVVIERLEGDRFYNAAHAGTQMKGLVGHPLPLTRRFPGGRAVLDRRPVIIDDIMLIAESEYPDTLDLLRLNTVHSCAEIPLLSEGKPLGNLAVLRAEVRPFTDAEVALLQTFADQAVIAIENVRLFKELEARNRDLTEALEQQTATAEILRVISTSPTDLQPVLDTLVASAARFCGAYDASLFQLDGEVLKFTAHHGPIPNPAGLMVRVVRGFVLGRAVLDRRPIQVSDIQTQDEAFPESSALAREVGYRTVLGVPLLREGAAIGAIGLRRIEAEPFTDKQIALLQTFADQAVIAIENVRLFKELEARNRDLTEALEQQTATAEILKVISSSPTSLEPVLHAVAESAARLCAANDAQIFRIEGELLRMAGTHGTVPTTVVAREEGVPVVRGTVTGRSVIDRQTIHIHDLAAELDEYPDSRVYQEQIGFRTTLATPLMREGVPLGAILIRRMEVRPFSDSQIKLLETFADQAAIAIENVRLFKELEARNRDLLATSQILQVISRSPTDVQPVFEVIADSAMRLFDATGVSVVRYDGQLLSMVAARGGTPGSATAATERWREPHRPLAGFPPEQTVLTKTMHHVADIDTDPSCRDEFRRHARERGFRSLLAMPMLRGADAVGIIVVSRSKPGSFLTAEIEMLQTFADQAVIAIENVRLFKELEARNRDLTEALEQQTATAEILRVISSSPTSVEAVFDTILENALRLCDTPTGGIFTFDGEAFHIAAAAHWNDEFLAALREAPIPPGPETPLRRVGLDLRPSHVADIFSDPSFSPPEMYRREGMRTALAVPMLKEGRLIGALTFHRREVRPFTTKQIALIETFADQAVIAIENVRLFKELQARNHDLTEALEQQTATSEILRVISQSQTDAQAVFDAIARSAVALTSGEVGGVLRTDGRQFYLAALHGADRARLEAIQRMFGSISVDSETLGGRVILSRTILHVPDMEALPSSPTASLQFARTVGFRSQVIVPMLRGDETIGAIAVARREPGPFPDSQIELLKTFADQAVIAVENVRLFKELQARTQELTQSVEQLTALGEVSRAVSSTLDVETVLRTVVSRARQLASADGCLIYEYDEATQQFHLRATDNLDAAFGEAMRRMPIGKGEGVSGRAAELGEPVQVADITRPGTYESRVRAAVIQARYRAVLSVPLLREDEIIGSLILIRKTPGEFSSEIVEALRTFATQSALAIQNARLFHEIEEKGRQLEVASRHKSQFLANMSHELRTPLNAILGYTELLLDGIYGEMPEKARETMGRIERSGRHLLALINDVLDLSKIEAGQLTLSLADYSLSDIVNTVVTAMEPLAAEKGLAVRVALDPGLPLARGDDRRLSQVLLNLVGNAVKFTDAGEVRIEGKVSDGAFLVSVSDTGPGIAAEHQARIFDEFQQVDASNTRKKGGTGLGLSIARRILALHGGRIWVESAPGQGATFSFTLPVRVERMAQTS